MDFDAQWLASLGVGGILAGGVFLAYRQEFLKERKNGSEQKDRQDRREERLLAIIERHAAASEKLISTIEKLDETLTEHHRFATAWTEKLADDVKEIRHDVKNLLVNPVLRDRRA